jgi:hypothetical protein
MGSTPINRTYSLKSIENLETCYPFPCNIRNGSMTHWIGGEKKNGKAHSFSWLKPWFPVTCKSSPGSVLRSRDGLAGMKARRNPGW